MQIFAAIKFASNNPIMIIKICVRIFMWGGGVCSIITLNEDLIALWDCFSVGKLFSIKYF